MSNYLDNEIQFLSGVGQKRATLLSSQLNIKSFRELLYFFPFRYIDRTRFYSISQIDGYSHNNFIQLKAKLISIREIGMGGKSRLSASFQDSTGIVEVLWFGKTEWIKKTLYINNEYIIFGKAQLFNNAISFIHPEVENISGGVNSHRALIYGVYPSTEKLSKAHISTKVISQFQANLLSICKPYITETLPKYILDKLSLMPLDEALLNIHFPQNLETLQRAQYRLKFEELFHIQLSLLLQKSIRTEKHAGYIFENLKENFNNYYSYHMPFELTNAQKKVLKEIRRDTLSGKQMNRLLQGDVGSGKTIVAFISILYAIDNGYQCAIMAPTEILASQHYAQLSVECEKLGLKCAFLTGSVKKKDRTKIHAGLESGEINLIIGTHALIEDSVQFKNLGYVVIDEQHRFGVKQRQRLWEKSDRYPHVLVMSATPIPRTLAMTLYGDLDISVIDELPPNRKPITTIHYNDSRRLAVFGFIKKEVEKGRQCYIVYPLIKESEKMDYKNLEDGYESITRAFPLPEYATSIVHGKMKAEDKDFEMQQFVSGVSDIMVATTVIEVGVNVPNATIMIIESAERFGLSQLHQLRGRVGRGSDQSYCILMSGDKLSNDSKKRLAAMVETNDGFELAELDLKLRGHGDLEGTQQSGNMIELKIASLSKDVNILEKAREVAIEVLEKDSSLRNEENSLLYKAIKATRTTTEDYSSIL